MSRNNYKTLYVCEQLLGDDNVLGDGFASGIKSHSDIFFALEYSRTYEDKGKKYLEAKIEGLIQAHGLEILIINLGSAGIIDPKFLFKLSNSYNIKIILILPDSEHNFEQQDRYYAQCADLSWILGGNAMVNVFEVYGFHAIGIFCVNNSVCQAMQVEIPLKDIDVSFVGGVYRANRKELLDFLVDNGINVYIAGHGVKRLSELEKNLIIKRSKIHLNFTGVENNSRMIFKRVKQNKGRNIEVAMLGTFLLTEYAKGIENIFKIGDEIDVFFSKEEMLDKVNFYLKNAAKREAMAQRAKLKAQESHGSDYVFSLVLQKLFNSTPQEKTQFFDRDFINWFTSIRFYYLARFLMEFKLAAVKAEFRSILDYCSIRPKNIYFDVPRGIYHGLKKYLIRIK